ncbi:MAG: putative FAD-dependent pyridine nucleotide-disulfide oxidoreductase [Chloroflexi bacterium]|nr:putative FAD-dependent pyridine nucleotide-disulfide oxidoreductase [Chloroflexota bacterium]
MAEIKDKLTIVLFSDDLDKVLAAFMIATTAASMGTEVSMFFTFWGLNVIRNSEVKIKSKGIMRKMLNIMNRGSARRLKSSKFNMLGLGTWMMKKIMKASNMPSLEELLKMAREMGIKLIPCSNTCGMMGLPEDAFINGVLTQAGAAYFLSEAKESRVTLFI